MRRVILNSSTLLSLLLSAATVVLWVRSYHPTGAGWKVLPPGHSRLLGWRGAMIFCHHNARLLPPWVSASTTLYTIEAPMSINNCDAFVFVANPNTTILAGEHGEILKYRSNPKILLSLAQRAQIRNGGGFAWVVFRLHLLAPSTQPVWIETYSNTSPVLWSVAVPSWLPILLFSILPAAQVLARYRRSQLARRAGLCRFCGYDLRATPARCPECGQTSSPIA